jgi:hypothetical protein
MMDLIIFYSSDKACMTYYINDEKTGYKIEYPFSYINNIYLQNGDVEMGKFSGLVVELNRPPKFFIESPGSVGFSQCGDFTEGQQASVVTLHHLGGQKILNDQLTKLLLIDSFINRHKSSSFFQGQNYGAFPNTFISHSGQVMVDQSMLHGGSVYNTPYDISDDGTGLNDMYSKHGLGPPRHTFINGQVMVDPINVTRGFQHTIRYIQ